MIKRKSDIFTIIGMVVAIGGLALGYYLEGGNFAALFGISAVLIIFGGTIGAVIITLDSSEVKEIPKTFKKIFTEDVYDFPKLIDDLCEWTRICRRDGPVSLGKIAEGVEDTFTKRGLEYILEGNDHEAIRDLLYNEIEATMERHKKGAKPYEQGGGYAPTMGIIGAVMGLVVVLGGLGSSGIEELGRGIAVAFLATLMGIGFANLLLLPFAEKLKTKSNTEILYKRIVSEGILGIQVGQNPTILKKKLETFLPESVKQKGSIREEGE